MDESGGGLGEGHVLLQFDLSSIPPGAVITSATLQLQAVSKTDIGSSNINVYEVTEAWDEGTGGTTAANWNNRQTDTPADTPWSTPGGTIDSTVVATLTTSSIGQHTWDITALVQDWSDGVKTNNGLMLAGVDTGQVTFTYDSREGTTPPQLVINYSSPVSNAAPTVSGTYTMVSTDEDTTGAAVQVGAILADASITANDSDGDTLGIAVIDKSGLGNWQYSTDGVSGWTDFGVVNPNAAVLLSATSWVRYVPDGVNGESAGFNFAAWDQTSDNASINGTPRFGDTTPGGGNTAYSSSNASVVLTVTDINDAPTVAVNTGMTIGEGSTGTVITSAMLNEGDPDDSGTGLTYTVTAATGNGTLRLNSTALNLNDTFTQDDIDNDRVTYDHNDSETTGDSFSFSLADGGEDGAGAAADTFVITITPVNDNDPVAVDDAIVVDEGATITTLVGGAASVLANDSDADLPNDTLTITVGTGPSHGSLTLNADGTFSYTHDGTENFADSFTYVVGDADGGVTDTGTVNITINPVNDNDPVAVNDAIVVNQGATITNLVGGATSVLTNDSDTDLPNDALSVTLGSGPSSGSLTLNADGTFSYTHDGSANLSDSFTYSITDADGGVTDTGTVNITVNLLSNPPTATNLNTAESFIEDVPLDLNDIVVTDVDSASVTVTLTLSDPAAGSLSTDTSGAVTSTFSGGVWTVSGAIANVNALLAGVVFTPSANYDSNFAITASVDDGVAAAVTGVKAVTGTPVGDTPRAADAATPINTTSGLIVIDPNPDDGAEVTHFRISAINNGTLYLADGTTMIHNGDFITVAQGQTGLRFAPTADALTNGSFVVEASQDGVSVASQSGTANSVITVIPLAGAPTVDPPEDVEESTEPVADPAPESPEPVEEPVEIVVEDVPEIAVPSAMPAPDGPMAKSACKVASGQLPFLANMVSFISQEQSTATGVKKTADRIFQKAKQSIENVVDKGVQLAERQARLYNLMSARTYMNMAQTLDELKEEVHMDHRVSSLYLGSAIVSSVGLSAGYVVWMLRGGMLLTSLLSSIPAWQLLDPLPILGRRCNDDGSDDDESLESLVVNKPREDERKEASSNGSSDAGEEA
jgi:VCBS repeat-containing protein